MVAYLIADVEVTDPATFEEYKREVPATEKRYGGRYLGRGGKTIVLREIGSRTAWWSSNFKIWNR